MPLPSPVRIHYHRPPDRKTVYSQTLVHDDNRVLVTLAERVSFPRPLVLAGEAALEDGADAVWFTFPGLWHDIGRFHLADGTFTGIYANMITPCTFGAGGEWETTDLFLDLWLPVNGDTPLLVDEDELEEAESQGWISLRWARQAREEGARILREFEAGSWPPPIVREWTRERALQAARG